MDRISTLIAALEDFKLRSKPAWNSAVWSPLVCPQLMISCRKNTLRQWHLGCSVVLKKFRWMPVLDLWDMLVERYAFPGVNQGRPHWREPN